ncbi:MAG: hypothetical protein WCD79_03160 [Chthoniobacteraceae bacterium]
MKTLSSSLHIMFALLVSNILFSFALQAQQPQDKDPIRATIEEKGWSDDGSLVLCVRIHAPASRDIQLYTGMPGAASAVSASNYKPISMSDSYLVDGYTGNKITPLQELPRKPFYGAMAMGARINRGGWIELGVAFSLPSPPLGNDGKPLPYKLTLFTPMNTPPIPIIPPVKP